MDSAFVTDERMLALVTEQLNNVLDRVIPVDNSAAPVGVCGFPCAGDCQTCEQSERDLAAFYASEAVAPQPVEVIVRAAEASASVEGGNSAPAEDVEGHVEVQVMAPAGDESQDSALEVARAMDALDEVQRSGDAFEEAHALRTFDCSCPNCQYLDDAYDERDYGDGYGLDWNESGYFD